MGYTYYNPLKVWLDPASIADVVSYMQTYLEENPIKDTEEINQIIADYIAAHPEIIGGVQSVNGETGDVVLTASDINTTGETTIQAVLNSLSSQISEIAQTVAQNTDDISDLNDYFQATDNLFYLSPLFDYPYTEKGITITPNDDGSFTLNGTATSTFRITLGSASNPDDAWIEAGVYSFGWEIVSGSSSVTSNSGVSLRAIENSTVVLNLSSLLSNTITFSEAGKCFIRIDSGVVLSNLRLKLMMNRGSSLLPFIRHGNSAIDIVARDSTERSEKSITTGFVYPLVVGTRNAIGQGGCLNGTKYVWMRVLSNGSCGLYGLDIITGSPIQKGSVSTNQVLGHCNDMTYNPNTNKYYVATMLETGALGVLSETYTYESSIILTDGNDDPVVTHGIAYDRIHDEYLAASETSDAVYVYDSSFVYQRTITLSSQITLTKQGIETDGYYIYYPLSNTDYICVVRTYTITGEFVEDIEIKQISGKEPEGLAYDWNAGYFLLNANSKNVSLSTIYCVCPNSIAYHAIGATMFALKYNYLK